MIDSVDGAVRRTPVAQEAREDTTIPEWHSDSEESGDDDLYNQLISQNHVDDSSDDDDPSYVPGQFVLINQQKETSTPKTTVKGRKKTPEEAAVSLSATPPNTRSRTKNLKR